MATTLPRLSRPTTDHTGAEAITRRGLANGIVVLAMATQIVGLARGVACSLAKDLRIGVGPKDIAIAVAAAALVVVATWLAVRAPARARSVKGGTPYRGGVP